MNSSAVTGRVLLLAPSTGLGGGIERYASAIEAVLSRAGVPCRRLNLRNGQQRLTLATRVRFTRLVRAAVRTSAEPVNLVLAHTNLLPVVLSVARLPSFRGAAVVVHGDEIWSGRRLRSRRWLRRADVRVVAASNFTAGALARTCRANILPSGISPEWYETLIGARTRARLADGELRVMTAFRLSSWRSKGLSTILAAMSMLRTDRASLTICGNGQITAELAALVAPHPWCRIIPDLTDTEFADQLADADVFVLATRTRDGADSSGEGFGLVLLEAQLAGTTVIAPAYAGSGDAFQPGVTGVAPLDETPAALAHELAELLDNEKRRREMSEAAAVWSATRFSPETYSRQLVRTFLG